MHFPRKLFYESYTFSSPYAMDNKSYAADS